MKKVFFLFCICKCLLQAAPFYQNPSPEAVYQWLQIHKVEQTQQEDLPFVSSLATTFIAQVIKVHPDYTESFIQGLPRFSAMEKSIFSQAFSIVGIQNPSLQGTEVSQAISLSELDHLEFKSGHDFDLMIVSFLATGDELFLSQPMAFLSSDPELLFFTYEWNNRQFLAKVLEKLTGQSELPDEAEFLDVLHSWPKEKQELFVLKLAAWKCLEFIKGEDPTAEEKISQLCKNNPRLDYQGTLTKLLN